MSSFPGAISWTPVSGETTLRQFRRAVLLALGIVALGSLIYVIEKYLVQPPRRFVENPSDVPMRALGLAHFLVGWLFLLSSPRIRTSLAAGRFLILAGLGVGFCLLYGAAGGSKNPLAVMAFYALFLIHEVGDQATLFRAYGDAPAGKQTDQFLAALVPAVALVMLVVLTGAFLTNDFLFQRTPVVMQISAGWLWGGFTGLVVLAVTAWCLTIWRAKESDVDPRLFRPLLAVYAGILTILALGSLLGSVGFNLIILIHVTSWLVFVAYQLGQRPVTGATGWKWLRATPSGFLTLHLSLAVILLVLMGLRVHAWERAGFLSQVLSSASFPYWSLLHIATTVRWGK